MMDAIAEQTEQIMNCRQAAINLSCRLNDRGLGVMSEYLEGMAYGVRPVTGRTWRITFIPLSRREWVISVQRWNGEQWECDFNVHTREHLIDYTLDCLITGLAAKLTKTGG